MSLGKYIKDKIVSLILYNIVVIILVLMLLAFKSNLSLVIVITLVLILVEVVILTYEYERRKAFYQILLNNLSQLDKKYLINALLPESSFLEASILEEVIYQSTKSMQENMNQYKYSIDNFKDYIELWIHEVKIPIASIHLILHNHKNVSPLKIKEQISRIENEVEQVLYYVRSENVEKDYLIKECKLKDIINKVIIKNKEDFIYKKIKVEQDNLETTVLSDSKWLEYIINQLIQNSLKYSKTKNAKIHIWSESNKNITKLIIEDNGIGIRKEDLPRVFEKAFTGENGRKISTSTGMGLYIVSKLIEKLNHQIKIESEENQYTRVIIAFHQTEYYDVVN